MAIGSAFETFAMLGGGEKGWASKPNDAERLHAPTTRWWAQALTTSDIMIKR